MRSTPIAWTHSTFNPWLGCLRVSPACDHCYAAAIVKRTGRHDGQGSDLWDPHAERVRTSPSYWQQPIAWNREALAAGMRHRVFCASMADIFDNRAPETWRADLWALIRATPALEWQLLTKRPHRFLGFRQAERKRQTDKMETSEQGLDRALRQGIPHRCQNVKNAMVRTTGEYYDAAVRLHGHRKLVAEIILRESRPLTTKEKAVSFWRRIQLSNRDDRENAPSQLCRFIQESDSIRV